MTLIPPQSLESERALLGACIVSRDALGTAIEILRPEDFYDHDNKKAYEVLCEMYLSDKPIDDITIIDEFKSKGIYERMGGKSYIAQITNEVVTTLNAGYYAEIIRDRSVRRRLIEAGQRITDSAYNLDIPASEIIEKAEKLLYDASQNKNTSEFRHVRDIISPVFIGIEERYRSTGEGVTGYPSGFADLDSYIGGFQPGSLNIIAARPSMGKTALAVNIAQFGGGHKNIPVLIFSLEMPSEQLVLRMLSAESRMNLFLLSKGNFDTDGFDLVREACSVLAEREIYINDDSNLTAIDFRTRCRRFKTRHSDVGLVIVDYLQLMTTGGVRSSDNRQQEVADISRMLKSVARELNCPVIALSQLSRETEKRTEKKPQLSDLRDSGAIEQDADVVMLMFREDYYAGNENTTDQDSKADIRIAKNRNGSTGTFHLTFKREITRFFNYGEL